MTSAAAAATFARHRQLLSLLPFIRLLSVVIEEQQQGQDCENESEDEDDFIIIIIIIVFSFGQTIDKLFFLWSALQVLVQVVL